MTVRLGIIGMGYAGRQHLAASGVIGDVQAVAVSDVRPPRDLPSETEFIADWRDLIRRSDIDAVSICLPHDLHQPAIAAALNAGKHVLVEKPLAATLDESLAVVQQAERSGKSMMVGLTHRFYAPVVTARKLVRQGALGRLLAVEDRIMETTPAGFPAWLLSRQHAGGGVALTNGVHMLDRIAFVTGEPLTFISGHAASTQQMGDIEDTAAMLLRSAGGAPVQFLAQWRRGPSPTNDDELTLYGTDATLRVWAWRGWRLEPLNAPVQEEQCYSRNLSYADVGRLGITGVVAEFVRAVITGEKIHPTVHAAVESQRLIESFYAAVARENTP